MLRLSARWLLLVVLAGAAVAARAGSAFEERVNALTGYWLAPSQHATQARVLRITNVIFAEPGAVVLAGFYGPPAALLAEAKDITARPEGAAIALDIVAADGTRSTLVTTADDRIRGAAKLPSGAASTLHFARASLPEVHRFIAENPLPAVRAGRRAAIELVYIGADDCSMCRGWEAAFLGPGRLETSPEWRHLRFTKVMLASLRTAFQVENAPERLRPAFNGMLADGLRIQGVPSFVLLVNGSLRAHALGTSAFDTLVHAALRAAVREKRAAERAPGLPLS